MPPSPLEHANAICVPLRRAQLAGWAGSAPRAVAQPRRQGFLAALGGAGGTALRHLGFRNASHWRFETRGTAYAREAGVEWMNGRATRQRGLARAAPGPARHSVATAPSAIARGRHRSAPSHDQFPLEPVLCDSFRIREDPVSVKVALQWFARCAAGAIGVVRARATIGWCGQARVHCGPRARHATGW